MKTAYRDIDADHRRGIRLDLVKYSITEEATEFYDTREFECDEDFIESYLLDRFGLTTDDLKVSTEDEGHYRIVARCTCTGIGRHLTGCVGLKFV